MLQLLLLLLLLLAVLAHHVDIKRLTDYWRWLPPAVMVIFLVLLDYTVYLDGTAEHGSNHNLAWPMAMSFNSTT